MENASKALLMAGGVLLVMLIVSFFIFSWGKFSEFYNQSDELAKITDITKFNLQFTNYDRDGVYGYELLSLANKVADYNFRKSNDSEAKNDEKSKPISLQIKMEKGKVNDKIAYGDTAVLFTSGNYDTGSINSGFTSLLSNISALENEYGKENLQNLSKSIGDIFIDESRYSTADDLLEAKKEVIRKFNSITKQRGTQKDTQYNNIANCNFDEKRNVANLYSIIQSYKNVAYKYYEYVQFKKAKFNSDSSAIQYDNVTQRITHMKFEFTGEVE